MKSLNQMSEKLQKKKRKEITKPDVYNIIDGVTQVFQIAV